MSRAATPGWPWSPSCANHPLVMSPWEQQGLLRDFPIEEPAADPRAR